MGLFDFITKREPVVQTLELKKAYDAARFGVAGVPAYPDIDRLSLIGWEKRNEVVFACIRKKCEAAADPEIIVETKNRKREWETYEGHPLASLIEKPNPQDTWDTFMYSWIASEEITGDFYAEIVRDRSGVPIQLWPLDPSCMFSIPDAKGGVAYYEFRSGYAPPIRLETEDVLHRRRPRVGSSYYGQSPLAIALGSVDADKAQTDFVRAFFHSDGIPAGLLKLRQHKTPEQVAAIQQQWMTKFRRGGAQHKQVAVIDIDTEFEKIGTNLKEIESEQTRGQIETRICMVFGVPPVLIGAYVGLRNVNQKASFTGAMQEFWLDTMSPLMKSIRTFLTWNLLNEFEDLDKIKRKEVRCNWDMSQVMAMKEDDNARHSRARENFTAGMWSINEARDATGMEPCPDDFFLKPNTVTPLTEAVLALLAKKEPEPPAPTQLQDPNTVDAEVIDEPKQIGDGKAIDVPDTKSADLAFTERLAALAEHRKTFTLPLIEGKALEQTITVAVANEDGAELITEMTVGQRQAQLQKKSDVLMRLLEGMYVENN